jgi:hypothetical protein
MLMTRGSYQGEL